MVWTVNLTKKAVKQLAKLPAREKDAVLPLLLYDLELKGPILPHWPNYSKLDKTTYHCHLSYKWVACWKVEDTSVRLIEIYYVGSREDAPY